MFNCAQKANDLGLTPDYLIVGEPTESRLALGHKGVLRLNISIEGKAGTNLFLTHTDKALNNGLE